MTETTLTKPISIALPLALQRLGISRPTMDKMLDANVFTVLAPRGRGVGKPLFLLTAEVEVYDRTRSEDAVREYRRRVGAELNPIDLGGEAGA